MDAPLEEAEADRMAARFKALSDPSRLRLLSLIAARAEVCACDLAGPLGLTQPTVSHHLKVLAQAGLLTRERDGKWIRYSVHHQGIEALRSVLAVGEPPAVETAAGGNPRREADNR